MGRAHKAPLPCQWHVSQWHCATTAQSRPVATWHAVPATPHLHIQRHWGKSCCSFQGWRGRPPGVRRVALNRRVFETRAWSRHSSGALATKPEFPVAFKRVEIALSAVWALPGRRRLASIHGQMLHARSPTQGTPASIHSKEIRSQDECKHAPAQIDMPSAPWLSSTRTISRPQRKKATLLRFPMAAPTCH